MTAKKPLSTSTDEGSAWDDPAQVMDRLIVGSTATRVPIATLVPADSPRLDGERIDHVRALADVMDDLPPILVHRKTMRVIDGMHRLRAAKMRGDRSIVARFFDGEDELQFVLAVRLNIAHGLPLSLSERKSAAARILASHGHWSDRTIATVTGLAPSTVGGIRAREQGEGSGPEARLGRDGRTRPLNAAEGRRLAADVLAQRPDASLREVAKETGVSPATVRDVRLRLADGRDPIPRSRVPAQRHTASSRAGGATGVSMSAPRDREAILDSLRHDPSLRFTESGRRLLRWLDARSRGPDGWEEALEGLPPHSGYLVADLAEWSGQRWLALADAVRLRAALDE